MILKARALNGSESSAWRSAGRSSSPLTGSRPWTAGTSSGPGREAMAGSGSGWAPLVLERGSAQHRRELDLERRLADRGDQRGGRDLGLLENQLHELVVVVGDL